MKSSRSPSSRRVGLRASLLACVVAAPLALAPTQAIAGDPREGEQIWAMAALQGGFGRVRPELARVKGYLELQSRWRGFGESFETGFFPRAALGYALNDQLTAFAGFTAVENDPAHTKPFTELRPWQQLTWNLPVERFTLQSRTRLEQRIIEDNLGWRLRELIKGTVSLPGLDRLYLSAYDELFFDLDDTTWAVGSQRSGFRQNRAFAGLGFRVDPEKHLALEAGYLNQWLDRRREDRVNHVLSLNLFLNY